jgi:DNA-binding NtrC family response regulator
MASGQLPHDVGWVGVARPNAHAGRRSGTWRHDAQAGATRLARVSLDAAPATVLVFSPRAEVRAAVRTALGSSPAPDVAPLTYVECSTGDEVIAAVDAGGIDLCVLDGEAQPTGGMGISRQLKYEIADCPALVVLIARQADRWLAHWSLSDATLAYPVDPLTAADVVAGLLRERVAQRPVVRR